MINWRTLLLAAILPLSCCMEPQPEPGDLSDLAVNFRNPSSQYGPSCWWWWLNGNVTPEAISSDLEAMAEKGFSGAVIVDAGGASQRGNKDVPAGPVFGSPQWRSLFVHALDEACRLGLEMGFNIQSGWNLGGPCITAEHAAKRLTFSEVHVSGSAGKIVLPEPPKSYDYYRDIAVLAFPVDSARTCEAVSDLQYKLAAQEVGGSATDCRFLLGNRPSDRIAYVIDASQVRDITSSLGKDGSLDWYPPSEEEWTVLRIGYTCTGARVSTCSEGWDGLVLDYLSADAFEFYVRTVLNPILKDAGEHVGKTLKYLETDSWECGGMNWTPGFEVAFRNFTGYDPLPYLPIAAGYVVDGLDESNAFLADLRKAVADAVARNHYGRLAEFAHNLGMGIQPESAGPHAAPLDGIRNYSLSDIAMSEFWAPSPHRPTPKDRFFVKQASSAAHVHGISIVGAESFTTIGPHWNDEIWCNQKPSFDHEICAGLNRVYFHTFTCSPAAMGLPGQEYFAGTHFNPRLTWWEESSAFVDYLTRIQTLAQKGQFVADVLYYYGDHVPNILPFKHSNIAGTMPGFDFDAADEGALLSLKVDRDGNLIAPSGLTYRVLVLPDHGVLSSKALHKVKWLLRKGAKVIGPKSERCVSLSCDRKKFEILSDKLQGNVISDSNAREYLLSTGLHEDFAVSEDSSLLDFDYIHYIVDGHDLYFISNMTDRVRDINCSFRVSGHAPELWNALDGSITALETFSQADGLTSVPLHFEAWGSAAVMFGESIPTDRQGKGTPNYKYPSPCLALDGPWTVHFDPAWGGPETVVFDTLKDWALSVEHGIRCYSGSALYCRDFEFSPTPGVRYVLDLGCVKDTGFASVSINGHDKGVVWTSPFRVDITASLRDGSNRLEIKVINSWYNRVAADMALPEAERLTRTNIMLDKDFRGIAKSEVRLSPSGLLGPVTISEIR